MGIPGSASPLLLVQAAGAAPAGYEIERSLRFNSGDSSALTKRFEATGNTKTWTFACWVKQCEFGNALENALFSVSTVSPTASGTDPRAIVRFSETDNFQIGFNDGSTGWKYCTSSAKYRDPSAWYHVVVAIDSTQATAADRTKAWINGEEVSWGSATYISQNASTVFNTASIVHAIGRYEADSTNNNYVLDGYLADVHFIDGQALAATDFGEYDANNVWQPKAFNNFNNPNNGTTWSSDSSTTIGSAAFDGLTTTNYLTLSSDTITWTPSTGIPYTSLEFASSSGAGGGATDMRYSINGGAEVAFEGAGAATLVTASGTLTSLAIRNTTASNCRWDYVKVNGYMMVDGAGNNSFHLPFSDNSSTIALGTDTSVTVSAAEANKGMDVVTYTGTGSAQTINGLRFAPDFVWFKTRSNSNAHCIADSVRGPSKLLALGGAAGTAAETTSLSTQDCTGFTSDGFSVGIVDQRNSTNQSGVEIVAWCWKAGGPAVTNTNGSITSQVSANQDYGFSIVAWNSTSGTAHTFGHGLSSAPKFVIVKKRSTGNWRVGHDSLGWSTALELNTSGAAFSSDGAYWNNTAPTSSVISIGDTGQLGGDNIAYCWSEVSGFSKMGTWTGDGNNPGPTITTGFKPAFVIWKNADSSRDWIIADRARGGNDPKTAFLFPNDASQELQSPPLSGGNADIKFLDNGFQLLNTDFSTNGSGQTYVYAAFASEPGNNWALNNFVANQTSTGFKPVLYTGNASTRSISGLGFSPDLVWIKERSSTADHRIFDTLRGATKVVRSNEPDAELTASTELTSFDSDGFSLGSSTNVNENNVTHVAWCWDAGSSTVSNTDGTITSSVRANTDLGFSIVTYTGVGATRTIGHGLGVAPAFIITKARNQGTYDWGVYHSALGATKHLRLNKTTAAETSSYAWNDTAPTSSVFTVSNASFSGDPWNYVAYCFAPKPGVSAFGSYTGNGNTSGNGPVVTLGFKPAFLMVKNVSSTSDWRIFDSARNPTSPFTKRLYANLSASESTNSTQEVTFTDNGFQVEASGSVSTYNVSGHTIIYIAFAAPPDGAEIDSLLDSPTEANVDSDTGAGGEVSGNYATLSPLDKGGDSSAVLSEGNLKWFGGTTIDHALSRSTLAVTSGKWYVEVTITDASDTSGRDRVGIVSSQENISITNPVIGNLATGYGYRSDGYKENNSSSSAYGASYTTGDVIGIALDMDAGSLAFYKNGSSQGTAYTGITGSMHFCGTPRENGTYTFNFGQRPFAYPVSGYQPLTTALLDDPTIADGSTAMDVVTYSSTNAIQAITLPGSGFQPDFVWTKSRSNAYQHDLYDAVRGAGSYLVSNSTAAAGYDANTLKSFDSAGFTLGNSDDSNFGSGTSVAWCWDGGSSTVSNTDGSITSSVRANASAGFSIVSYTGTNSDATVGHGLGVTPSLIIVKCRTTATYSTTDWYVFTQPTGKDAFLVLNKPDASASNSGFWGTPNSSTFGVKNASGNNVSSSDDHIAYCWAPVEGYSAFGSYTGNGGVNFVYLGFKPKWLLIKAATTTSLMNWVLLDGDRPEYNVVGEYLYANASNAAGTATVADFVSNGFAIRSGTDAQTNNNGSTYIYAAFGDPFKTSRAR